jgi:hypothetical protein
MSSIPRTARSASRTTTPSTELGKTDGSSRCPTGRSASTSRSAPGWATLAPSFDNPPARYRGLRAEALALLLYLGNRVHALSGEPAPLTVTRAVSDDAHQRQLGTHPEVTPNYSLHTTGYAFDILRRYHSGKQAAAFQYELERLQARGLIAWIRNPRTIHVTVSSEAKALVDTMLEPAHPRSTGARP